jgi:putative ATP-binding cassette transporter
MVVFWRRRLQLNRMLERVYAHEAAMLDSMAHFTDGFQEIRLNADKNDSCSRTSRRSSTTWRRPWSASASAGWCCLQFSNAFLYALAGVVILVLPAFFAGATDAILQDCGGDPVLHRAGDRHHLDLAPLRQG